MDLPNTAASVYTRRAFRTRALGLALSSALVLGMAQPGRASEPLPPLPVVAAPGGQAELHTMSVTPVAAGDEHSLMLAADGTVWSAGANDGGQLGIQSRLFESSSATPVQVEGLTAVKAVAAGGTRSVALKADGTVWEWGFLGPGSSTHTATRRPELSGVVAVAAGGLHVLALKSDGTVWTWSAYGPGAQSVSQVPLTDVVAVAGGAEHSLALKSDGTVWAWGRNDLGQVGTGSASMDPVTQPVQVQNMAVAIAAGGHHSLAVRSDGTVWEWGDNGIVPTDEAMKRAATKRATPSQVAGLTGVTAVAAAAGCSLALKSDGTVWTWGGSVAVSRDQVLSPLQVPSLSGVVALAAGRGFAVAAKGDGTVWSWGYNNMGQLADGTTSERSVPVSVGHLPAVAAPSRALGSVQPMQVASPVLTSDVPPVMVNGKVLVPIRPVADWLGIPVAYDPATRALSVGENIAPAYPGGIYPLKLQMESLSILQTDAAYTLTVPPMIHQGRVMVEADLLGKLFHFQHRWNPETRELVLSGPGGQTARMLLTEQSFQVTELQARVAAAISASRAAEQAAVDNENRQIAAEEARKKAALLVPSYANLERDSASHLGQVASFTGVMMKDGVNAEGVHGAFLATADGFVMVLSDSDLGLVGKRVRITGRVRQPYVYPMAIGDLVIPTIVYQAHEVR